MDVLGVTRGGVQESFDACSVQLMGKQGLKKPSHGFWVVTLRGPPYFPEVALFFDVKAPASQKRSDDQKVLS